MAKITIRPRAFETNSSSQHAYVHLNEEAFHMWADEGAYIDMRGLGISDYVEDPQPKTFTDISDKMIGHAEIGRVRKDLPQETYYRDPDDCLLEAGILPYNAIAHYAKPGTPSQEWKSRCGGLNYILCEDAPDGGYNITADWYAW